jgi:hypothetical protein
MNPSYSPDELAAAAKMRSHFPTFAKLLKIKTKNGLVVDFTLNKAQRELWRLIQKMESRNEPVRIIILKARQLGMSTFVQAYLLWKAITSPGTNGLVVAHLEDPASELFSKIEMMYRLLPKPLFDELESIKDTSKKGKKLAFAGDLNTLLYVDTANNPALGRGMTFQHCHLSEMAFYNKPEEIMFGLSQSVPNKPGTSIIIESTANGMGNYFHSLWERVNDPEQSSRFEPLFLPWFSDPDYVETRSPDDKPLDKGERAIKREYKLSDEQMLWRRVAIQDGCDGDEEKFKQENPATPQEAFLISGSPYFQKAALEWYYKNTKPAVKQGSLRIGNDNLPFLDEHDDGPWRVWKSPELKRQYIICADVAGGTARDFSAAHVIDAQSLEQVASYRGKLDPDEFARELNWMGRSYNDALMAVERNGEGRATTLKLQRLHYPKLFYHTSEEQWSGGVCPSWGWVTSSKTRPTMMAQASELIREKYLKINDSRTVSEMMSFVRVPTSKIAEGAVGAWDDMVMALCIGCSSEVRNQALTFQEFDNQDNYEPGVSTLTGY